MKDAIIFFLLVLALNFLFKGEPNLHDLLHERAIEAVSKEKNA
jgi:hypothetical protein